MEVKLICPFHVMLPRKTKADKKMPINLNAYRNWHPMVESQVKKKYAEIMWPQIQHLVFDGEVEITYQVFKPSKRRLDKMNVLSITSKYLLDAISEAGCWEDDNDDIVKDEHLKPTELDRNNPRVEVTIKTLN